MSNRIAVNKEVNVTALYFRGRQLESFPKRMEFNGREYTFMDGLRYLVHKGQRLIRVFDMTDGTRDYRLNLDVRQQSWTLVDITGPHMTVGV